MRTTRGFTLLEVLVAVAVLGVALAALIKVGSQHADNSAYLRDRTHAHWVAMNVMAGLRGGLSEPAVGTRQGGLFMADREWFWRTRIQSVRPSVMGRQLDPLLRVDIAVYAEASRDGEALTSLIGYMLP